MVGYPIAFIPLFHRCAYLVAGGCCRMQCPLLGKITDDRHPSSASLALSSTKKATQQDNFQVNSSLILLCPASKVHSIFSNTVLPVLLSNQEQCQKPLLFWRCLGGVFYQQLIGRYPMLGTEFSFNNPRLPGATPPGTAI